MTDTKTRIGNGVKKGPPLSCADQKRVRALKNAFADLARSVGTERALRLVRYILMRYALDHPDKEVSA